jgi:hypothetical protein
MLAHHALEMPGRRTGLTNARWIKIIEHWHKLQSSGRASIHFGEQS